MAPGDTGEQAGPPASPKPSPAPSLYLRASGEAGLSFVPLGSPWDIAPQTSGRNGAGRTQVQNEGVQERGQEAPFPHKHTSQQLLLLEQRLRTVL